MPVTPVVPALHMLFTERTVQVELQDQEHICALASVGVMHLGNGLCASSPYYCQSLVTVTVSLVRSALSSRR